MQHVMLRYLQVNSSFDLSDIAFAIKHVKVVMFRLVFCFDASGFV